MAVAMLTHKVVSTLPGVLEKNSIYFVRVGAGFDIYVTNDTGTVVAYPLNQNGGGGGSVSMSSGVIDAVWDRQSEYTWTITDAACTTNSKILIQHGTYTSDDENEDEVEDILSVAVVTVNNGSFDVRIVANWPIVWVFKFNYLIS